MNHNKLDRINSEEFIKELYLLIHQFLSGGPCKNAADALKNEIIQHQILENKVGLFGEAHGTYNFDQMLGLYSHVNSGYLPDLLIGFIKHLRLHNPLKFDGITSLLSSSVFNRVNSDGERCNLKSITRPKNAMRILVPSLPILYPFPYMNEHKIQKEIIKSEIFHHYEFRKRTLGHLASVYCTTFDKTGSIIITGSDDTLIKMWKTQTGQLLSTLRGHVGAICDLAVNPENTILASASSDKTVRVWCMQTSAQIIVLTGHSKVINAVSFSPYIGTGPRYLTSVSSDAFVYFWKFSDRNFNTNPIIFDERLKPRSQMLCMSYSPGGLYLAVGASDSLVRIFKLLDGVEKTAELEGHTDRVDSILFDGNGEKFLTGSADGTCRIWTPHGYKWKSIVLNTRNNVKIDETEDLSRKSKSIRINMLAWNLSNTLAIAAVSDKTVKLWDAIHGHFVHSLEAHSDEIFSIEMHTIVPDVLITAGHDGRIIIWDLSNFTIIKQFLNEIHNQGSGAIFDCKVSPDGHFVSATDSHGHLCIFGLGASENYKTCPDDQFFHTDYRPVTRDDDSFVYDEQTNMLPHLLPPPLLVDVDGIPHSVYYQLFAQNREGIRRYASLYRNESGVQPGRINENTHESQDPPAASINESRPGLRESGDVEGVRRTENVYLYNEPTAEEKEMWRNRIIAAPVKKNDVNDIQIQIRTKLESEVQYYQFVRQLHQSSSGIDMEERIAKLMSLKSSISSRSNQSTRGDLTFDEGELTKHNQEPNTTHLRPRRRTSPIATSNEVRNATWTRYQSVAYSHDDYNSSIETETEEDEQQILGMYDDIYSDKDNDDDESFSGSSSGSEWQCSISSTIQNVTSRTRAQKRKKFGSTDSHYSRSGSGDNHKLQRLRDTFDHDSSINHEFMDAVDADKIFNETNWFTYEYPRLFPYFPQIGDDVCYFHQGHRKYVEYITEYRIANLPQEPIYAKQQFDLVEFGRVISVSFTKPPVSFCSINIARVNESGSATGSKFNVIYRHLANVPDFIVLKQVYDSASLRNWHVGDKIRHPVDNIWRYGKVIQIEPYDKEYKDSPFLRYIVKWESVDSPERLSHWDLFPVDDTPPANSLENAHTNRCHTISMENMEKLHYQCDDLDWHPETIDVATRRIEEAYISFSQVCICQPFLDPVDVKEHYDYSNYVACPTNLNKIMSRLHYGYYRRKNALIWEIKLLSKNAASYNLEASMIVIHANLISQLLLKLIRDPSITDLVALYDEQTAYTQASSEIKQLQSRKINRRKFHDDASSLVFGTDLIQKQRFHDDIDSKGIDSTHIKLRPRHHHHSARSLSTPPKEFSWITDAMLLLRYLTSREDAKPFLFPVDQKECEDYFDYVERSMDFSTVESRLRAGKYSSPLEMIDDISTIFSNSRIYNTNPRSKIYGMTIRLNNLFCSRAQVLSDQWVNSEFSSHGNSNGSRLTRLKSNSIAKYAAQLCDAVSSQPLVFGTSEHSLTESNLMSSLIANKNYSPLNSNQRDFPRNALKSPVEFNSRRRIKVKSETSEIFDVDLRSRTNANSQTSVAVSHTNSKSRFLMNSSEESFDTSIKSSNSVIGRRKCKIVACSNDEDDESNSMYDVLNTRMSNSLHQIVEKVEIGHANPSTHQSYSNVSNDPLQVSNNQFLPRTSKRVFSQSMCDHQEFTNQKIHSSKRRRISSASRGKRRRLKNKRRYTFEDNSEEEQFSDLRNDYHENIAKDPLNLSNTSHLSRRHLRRSSSQIQNSVGIDHLIHSCLNEQHSVVRRSSRLTKSAPNNKN